VVGTDSNARGSSTCSEVDRDEGVSHLAT